MGVLTDAQGSQGMGVRIEAVLWPVCVCGCAYATHVCLSCDATGCSGYRPSRPVRYLGTRAYRPSGKLAAWRRATCGLLWKAESRLQRWRERLDPP